MKLLLFGIVMVLIMYLTDLVLKKIFNVEKEDGSNKPVNITHVIVIGILGLILTFSLLFLKENTNIVLQDSMIEYTIALYVFVSYLFSGFMEKRHSSGSRKHAVTILNGLFLSFLLVISSSLGLFGYLMG